MRIGFIGAGRVGCTMGKYLGLHGCSISGYSSRTRKSAEEAAEFTDTQVFDNRFELIDSCDIVMLTVSDREIIPVWNEIKDYEGLTEKIVCHTSGAMSSEIFKDTPYQVYGYSVHPIYAVSDRFNVYRDFSNAFITIEGSPEKLDSLLRLFTDAGLKTGRISSNKKVQYHASCVMASNLVCGLYGAAVRLMSECGMTEEDAEVALKGLFRDNALGIVEKGAVKQLTGPLERGDAVTVRKHLDAFGDEEVKEMYTVLSRETMKLAAKKNPQIDYDKIFEEVLR